MLALAPFVLAAQPRPTVADVVYAETPQKDLLLDLYLPDKRDHPVPVILSIHGGGWRRGGKENPRRALTALPLGFAVASITYRLSSDAIFPAQVHDAKAAVRWLRANADRYGLDSERIVAIGGSAGGHLAALLGTSGGVSELEGDVGVVSESSEVQVVIDLYGPTDFLKMDKAGSKMRHDSPDSPESKLIGGAIQNNKAKTRAANPIAYVTPDDPPFLIIHGDADESVPVDQSRLLVAALRDAGVSVEYHEIVGAGHGLKGVAEVEKRIVTFLERLFGSN